jgi:hypothetical protein
VPQRGHPAPRRPGRRAQAGRRRGRVVRRPRGPHRLAGSPSGQRGADVGVQQDRPHGRGDGFLDRVAHGRAHRAADGVSDGTVEGLGQPVQDAVEAVDLLG